MNKYIETNRLILRPLKITDASDVYEWVSDPDVNRFMLYPLYTDIDQVKKWISYLQDEDNEFAFCLKDTGKVIGAGSIRFKPRYDAYEIGYNLNRQYWGKGYASEAAKALIEWAYQELGARVFCARHANANIASEKVIKKCGFQFVKYDFYKKIGKEEPLPSSFYIMYK